MGDISNTNCDVPKEMFRGALWGAAFGTGHVMANYAGMKKAINNIGTKDTFSPSKVLEHISRDTIKNIDTYNVKNTKVNFNAPLDTVINFDNTSAVLKDGLKKIKKHAPESILKEAAITGCLFGALTLVFNAFNKVNKAKAAGKNDLSHKKLTF